jgi:glycine dehydrogenase subunit 1
MTYIPISPGERDAMLATIGVKSLEDLFRDVPVKRRFPKLDLPPALTEMEAAAELQELAFGNEEVRGELVSFLGAGAYNHYIPSAVDHILRRGEFYTAYTPYQPEVSQGTLQAMFEYQSLISSLTGMEVSNASHYDGATAVAEAVNMAYAQFRGKRTQVVISPTVHPQYRAVLRTYIQGMGMTLVGDDARADLESGPALLGGMVDAETALVIVQYPDFFGRIYDYTAPIEAAQNPWRDGRRHRGRRRPAARHPALVRWTLSGFLYHPPPVRPQDVRAPGGRNGRQPRPASLRPDPDGSRAAHQAREGHI